MLQKQLKFSSNQFGTSTQKSPYNLVDTIILNILARNNLLLIPSESYLKYNANLASGVNGSYFRWNCCDAHGPFNASDVLVTAI